jgi:hypothetical protein
VPAAGHHASRNVAWIIRFKVDSRSVICNDKLWAFGSSYYLRKAPMPPMIAYNFLFGGMHNRAAPTISAVGADGGGMEPSSAAAPKTAPGLWSWIKGLLRRPTR